MTIGEIIRYKQPNIYFLLMKVFGLEYSGKIVVDFDTAEEEEPVDWKIRNMMTEKSGVRQ